MIRLGVDTGGTFTDLVRLDARGLTVHKVRSTPEDPARAILSGIRQLMGTDPVFEVIHGSTVATNALLERKGARVALVTTKGFEDVLAIGRQTRRELYNFQVRGNRPMIDAGLIFGLTERLDCHGKVLEALQPRELDDLVEKLASGQSGLCGRVPSSLLRKSTPRAAGCSSSAASRLYGLILAQRSARISRVRALEHDSSQRLRHADHVALSYDAGTGARWNPFAHHAIERRLDLLHPRPAIPRCAPSSRVLRRAL